MSDLFVAVARRLLRGGIFVQNDEVKPPQVVVQILGCGGFEAGAAERNGYI